MSSLWVAMDVHLLFASFVCYGGIAVLLAGIWQVMRTVLLMMI